MYLTRGQPVVYYGDEQGFVGDGGDQDAREDMFPSQVASYNDNDLIGTDATTAEANFDPDHPLYRHIAELSRRCARSTRRWPTARRSTGTRATKRASTPSAASTPASTSSTSSPRTTRDTTKTADVPTYAAGQQFTASGRGEPRRSKTDASGQLTVPVPALSAVV